MNLHNARQLIQDWMQRCAMLLAISHVHTSVLGWQIKLSDETAS